MTRDEMVAHLELANGGGVGFSRSWDMVNEVIAALRADRDVDKLSWMAAEIACVRDIAARRHAPDDRDHVLMLCRLDEWAQRLREFLGATNKPIAQLSDQILASTRERGRASAADAPLPDQIPCPWCARPHGVWPVSDGRYRCAKCDRLFVPVRPGDIFRIGKRTVEVSGMPDGTTVCRDSRGRIAVRNVESGRLSYVTPRSLRVAAVRPLTFAEASSKLSDALRAALPPNEVG